MYIAYRVLGYYDGEYKEEIATFSGLTYDAPRYCAIITFTCDYRDIAISMDYNQYVELYTKLITAITEEKKIFRIQGDCIEDVDTDDDDGMCHDAKMWWGEPHEYIYTAL